MRSPQHDNVSQGIMKSKAAVTLVQSCKNAFALQVAWCQQVLLRISGAQSWKRLITERKPSHQDVMRCGLIMKSNCFGLAQEGPISIDCTHGVGKNQLIREASRQTALEKG